MKGSDYIHLARSKTPESIVGAFFRVTPGSLDVFGISTGVGLRETKALIQGEPTSDRAYLSTCIITGIPLEVLRARETRRLWGVRFGDDGVAEILSVEETEAEVKRRQELAERIENEDY